MDGGGVHGPALVAMLLALFCSIECLVSLEIWRSGARGARLRERLRVLAADLEPPGSDPETQRIVREELGSGAQPRWRRAVEAHAPFQRLSLLLHRAGIGIGTWRFALLCLGGALACVALAGALGVRGPVAAAAPLGGLVPLACALHRKRRRTRLFETQLPEALDLICRGLRAGHALSMGIKMVADELDDPIAGEFGHVADEIAVGIDARRALASLCTRVDVPDLGFFRTAVLIQRETGGNLADVMERLAAVIRGRHEFEGKVRALTAQNRGAALVLLATPPGFVLLMQRVSPEFVAPLFQDGPGRTLAWVAAGLTVAGYALARRLAVVHA